MTGNPQTEMNMKEAAIEFIKRLFIIIFCFAGALFILLILMGFLFMLGGLAYEDDLVGEYAVLAVDTRNDAAVCMDGLQVVSPMVVAYGWNDDFILAKRHPTLDGRTPDLYTTAWYLIEVRSAKVHGPLTEQEFTGLRAELGVPEELTFTKRVRPD